MNEDEKDEDVQRLLRLTGRRPPVPQEIEARVRSRVHEAWRSEVDAAATEGTRRRFIVALPLAAAAAIAFVLFVRPSRQQIAPAAPIARIERAVGDVRVPAALVPLSAIATGDGRAAIRMSDGTSVRVDSRTRLRLDDARTFTLASGAIYIDTARSGVRVRTPFGIIRDIGTKFEVRVRDAGARVRVRDGEVAIGKHHARRGEQLDVGRGGSVSTDRIMTWGDDWSWVNDVAPPFAVEGKRVAEFVIWFASESGMEVRYDSQPTSRKAATAVLHGSIGNLGPVAAAEAVLPAAGLRADVKNGVLTVRQQ